MFPQFLSSEWVRVQNLLSNDLSLWNTSNHYYPVMLMILHFFSSSFSRKLHHPGDHHCSPNNSQGRFPSFFPKETPPKIIATKLNDRPLDPCLEDQPQDLVQWLITLVSKPPKDRVVPLPNSKWPKRPYTWGLLTF